MVRPASRGTGSGCEFSGSVWWTSKAVAKAISRLFTEDLTSGGKAVGFEAELSVSGKLSLVMGGRGKKERCHAM